MTKFRPAVMTDAGQSLATQAESGQIKLTFTKGVLSSDDLSQLGQTAIQQTTALDPFITATINKSNIISANKIALPLNFSNEQMTEDNYAKTVGVYASDGTTEYLYALCINDAPYLISAYNGSTPEALEIEFRTEVGRASTVNVTVSPLDTVNRDEFQTAISRLKTIATLTDNDDILKLNDNGHYIVSGANPKNNPWDKQIWGDVYKTDYGVVIRDNIGHEYIRSNYDNVWKRTLNDTEDLANINNEFSNVNNAIAQAQGEAQYSEVGQLSNDDDVLDLTKNGHYTINGTNPRNNPWGKQIWADVYKTKYLIVLRDNEGAEFIRSYYDNTWKRTINSIDQQALQSSMTAISDSLGDWDRSGFDSLGGSVSWLKAENNNRISDIQNLSTQAKSEAQYNEVAQLGDNDDLLNLSQNGHYVVNGSNPKNNPWNKQIWADVYKTTYGVVIRDNVGHEYIRSNYDSVWKRTLNDTEDLANIDNELNSKVTFNGGTITTGYGTFVPAAIDQAYYNVVAELQNSDDILNLSKNGHYVIRGANPQNNPWGKDIWGDVYKSDYNIVMRDNVGGEFIRSYYDSTWKRTLNSVDLDILNTQINAVSNKAQYDVVAYLQDGDDLFNLPQKGHYVVGGTNPKNNPWGKQIWCDVFVYEMSEIAFDNVGGYFIRTPNGWRGL